MSDSFQKIPHTLNWLFLTHIYHLLRMMIALSARINCQWLHYSAPGIWHWTVLTPIALQSCEMGLNEFDRRKDFSSRCFLIEITLVNVAVCFRGKFPSFSKYTLAYYHQWPTIPPAQSIEYIDPPEYHSPLWYS